MGKLVVNMFVTLDGVIQSPGRPEEDTEGSFDLGGWQQPFSDDREGKVMTRAISRIEALVLGRKTYDIFAAYWPKHSDNPIGKQLNAIPKYVASRKLKKAAWNNSTVLEGELADQIPRIKEKHKEIHTFGSSQLIPALLGPNLVDSLDLWLYPLVLGKGKRLFPEGTVPTSFRLKSSEAFEKGAVHLTYEPAGAPTFGSL